MFNSQSSIRHLFGDENVENDTSDEYFSSIESDDEDDIFDFDDYDSDDVPEYSDGEINDEFDHNLSEEKDDNFHFTFGDTITKALILWAVNYGMSYRFIRTIDNTKTIWP